MPFFVEWVARTVAGEDCRRGPAPAERSGAAEALEMARKSWIKLRELLLRALEQFPDAREAVVVALRQEPMEGPLMLCG